MTTILRSGSILNLDTLPVIPNTIGIGAPGPLRYVGDGIVIPGDSNEGAGSIYRVVRFPTNAKIKTVLFSCTAFGGTAAFDIDVAWSDSTIDFTSPANQGNIIQLLGGDNKLFGSAVSAVTAVTRADQTFSNPLGYFNDLGGLDPRSLLNYELWQALNNIDATLGFSTQPAGMFDLVLKQTGTPLIQGVATLEVEFIE